MTMDQMGRTVDMPADPQRIISLVPSQTELLHDLGLGDRVVGITKFCIHPEEWFRSKPRIGGTKNVDLEKVRALRPDLIIGNKEENERSDIEALEREFPVWMSDVRDLEGALDMVLRIGALTGRDAQATSLRNRIEQAFAALRPLAPSLSVAYLIWRKPYMAAGPGTFVHDMLRRCGLRNVFGTDDARYPEIPPALLAGSDPDVVLLSSEPYPFGEAHLREISLLLPGTPIRLVDGEAFSWYGSRLLGSPAYFQGLMEGLTAPSST